MRKRGQKFGEKGEGEENIFFLVKMPLRYILSIPKCKNMFRSALKLHLMSLKLIFQFNSFIQTSETSKNHFGPLVAEQLIESHRTWFCEPIFRISMAPVVTKCIIRSRTQNSFAQLTLLEVSRAAF
jgi:hypothetical protein